MNKLFYLKLALINVKNNSKTYFPYIITCICTISMFYIMQSLSVNEALNQVVGANSVRIILSLGTKVIGIFSAIFLFYTNSFLIKRRKREFGLYNVLGLEKKHIDKILFFESTLISEVSLLAGIILGLILNKLIFLLLLKILTFDVKLGFSISTSSIVITLIVFLGIFIITLLTNLFQLKISKPIELLKGGEHGEREPKTKWIIAVVGLISLTFGYGIALAQKDSIQVIDKFFFAVILVMIGTYALFTTGSIVILKLLRKNKWFYYKTRNFISVSSMIYRMKQNAVGLANICILSTAVIIILSTTVSLYVGMEDILRHRFPSDVTISVPKLNEDKIEEINRLVDNEIKDSKVNIINIGDRKFKIKEEVNKLEFARDSMDMVDTYVLVLNDINSLGKSVNKGYQIKFDVDGNDSEMLNIVNRLNQKFIDSGIKGSIDSIAESREGFFSLYGSLLFLGLFLGVLFLMATVLIIYYKQISEGYDDKERFEIMQKVGMSKVEIREIIRSQILMVFFLPLMFTVIHITFAFPIITKVLAVLNLTNVPLFRLCAIVTIIIFAIIYGIVFVLTAKTYYKIVK